MTLTLRAIRPEDDSELFRIYASSRADEMKLVPWTEEQQQAFLRMQYEAQRDYYFQQFPTAQYQLILFQNEVAGRLYVLREAAANRILDIALLPEMRRRGIATKLIKELLGEASAAGKALRIYVESFNPALCLFAELGFVTVSEDGFILLLEHPPE